MPTRPYREPRAAAPIRLRAALIAAAFAAVAPPARGAAFTIDGASRLDALPSSLPSSGVQRVRFTGDGYRNPGSLTLSDNGCDSLVFERMSPADTAALRIQGTLLRIKGQRGTVVLRGLALRLEGGGALFDTSLGGNNGLILDGCTLLGNGAGPAKALAWSGEGKISLANCMFANTGATALGSAISVSIVNSMFVSTGPVTLTETAPSGGVALFNNLFNFPGVLLVSAGGRLEMWYNTVNRTQLHLDGKTTGSFSIHNNYFAHPPSRNFVAETGTARYVAAVKPGSFLAAKSLAVDNVRYPGWDGYENPLPAPLFGTGNTTVSPARDSATAWDWRIAGDTAHGAWNGALPLPAFNLFPPDTAVDLPIPGGRAIVAPRPFPRRLRFSVKAGSAPYSSSLPDSVRPWFRSDTLLAMEGDAALVSVTLPARDDGAPLLFARLDAGFLPGPPDPRGSARFRNAHAGAREFLPALGGQNTFRGTNVAAPHPALPGLSLIFSSVTRTGTTAFGAPPPRPSQRKWRIVSHQGREIAFTASTNAEGGGTVRFGVPVSGTPVFRKDSLFFWRGGDSFLPAKDSAGGYWAAVPAPPGRLEAVLVERMAFGPGADSLILPRVRLYANSAGGHQLAADSGSRGPVQDDPYLGAFGAVLKFSWPGRLPGDSLVARFPRTDPLQQAWIRRGTENSPLPLLPGDAGSLRIALGIADSNQVFFVARRFGIPAGRAVSLAFGSDSVPNLLSSRPGDLAIDAAFRPADLDTSRFVLLAARGIRMDSLVLPGPYTLSLAAKAPQRKELARALAYVNGIWEATTFTENGGRYAIQVPPPARAAMMVELLSAADWSPALPAAAAGAALRGDSLVLSPGLTAAERAALPWFRADLLSLGPDGDLRLDKSRYAPVESSLSVGLAADRLYAYRVIYRSPLDRFPPDRGWIPLSARQPDAAVLEARIPLRQAKFRHLIGFPFDGATAGAHVAAGMEGGSGEILALDTIASGKWSGLAPAGRTRLERGKGYLLAAGKPFRLKAKGAAYSGLKPDTLRFDRTGWHLIANPLPYPYARAALGVPDSAALSFPRSLRRLDTAAGSPAAYEWPVPDTLRPFEGYLLYVFKPTFLAFDPYTAAAAQVASGGSVAAAKTAAAPEDPSPAPGSDALRLTLTGPRGSQSAVFYRSGPFLPTPYMRPFSDGARPMEFRAGGGAGWAYRKIERTDSAAIPLEILAPEAGVYSLRVSGADAGPGERAQALLDLRTGKVHGAREMAALALDEGPHAFTLLHGKAVPPGVSAFAAGLPRAFALDQNFPNPFRGTTRVRFRVPPDPGGFRRARFKVTAPDGRLVESRDLGALTAGEHAITVGGGGWRTGVYFYELSLESDGGPRTLRRKMVCGSPGN